MQLCCLDWLASMIKVDVMHPIVWKNACNAIDQSFSDFNIFSSVFYHYTRSECDMGVVRSSL